MTRRSSPAAALDAWLWRHNRRPPASANSAQVTVTEGSIRIRRSGSAGASPTLMLLCATPPPPRSSNWNNADTSRTWNNPSGSPNWLAIS